MIKDVNNNGFQELNSSILKHPFGNPIFSIIGCTLLQDIKIPGMETKKCIYTRVG